MTCPTCNGCGTSSRPDDYGPHPDCSTCGGSGEVEEATGRTDADAALDYLMRNRGVR